MNRQDIQYTPARIIAHPDAIKISVDSFFKIYDKDRDGKISRLDLKEALGEIFKSFEVEAQVTERDVENFLADFNITNGEDITVDDFKGVEFIRFDLQAEAKEALQGDKDIMWQKVKMMIICQVYFIELSFSFLHFK